MTISKGRVRTNKLRNYWWTRGYMSAADTVRFLGVDQNSVYRWMNEEKLISLSANGKRYVQISSIAKHLAEDLMVLQQRLKAHFAKEDAGVLTAKREAEAARDRDV